MVQPYRRTRQNARDEPECEISAFDLVCEGLLTVAEAASFLGLSRASIYNLNSSGELPFVKIGGARRIPKRAVIELAARSLRGGLGS